MGRVSFRDLFVKFFGTLESARTGYVAYGGVVAAIWGEPRETQDVDAVVTMPDEDAQELVHALQSAGFACAPEQARTFLIDGWIRMDFGGRHADVALARTPFDASALSRRKRMTLFELPIWIASAEDLLLYKLVAYRYKDLADAESVIARQRGRLDLGYLRHWADEIARHTSKFEVPRKLAELLSP